MADAVPARLAALAAATVLAAGGLAGCGGSDDSASPAPSTTEEATTETFVDETAEVQQEIAGVFLEFADGLDTFLVDLGGCSDFDCLEARAEDLRDLTDDTDDALAEIDVEERGNACQEDVVGDFERGLSGMEDTADALEQGDVDAVGSVAGASRADLDSAIEDLNDCL